MSPATYGSLFADAVQHLEAGKRQVHFCRFEDRDDATAAISAYYGLLDATRQHVFALVTPARMAGLATSHAPQPVEASALALASSLQIGPHEPPPHPSIVAPPRHPWDYAARSLRLAADLLGSHVTITGGALTPDAIRVWDEGARHGALGRLGGFVAQLTTAQDALALRAGQAGLRWERVGGWLPRRENLTNSALELVRSAETTASAATSLDGLSPATSSVRQDQPADALGDLVARIRRTAWSLRTEPDYSTQTLADVARAGFEIAASTATFHGIDLHDRDIVARDPNARRTAAWLRVMGELRGYASPGPGNRQIRSDVAEIHDLLTALVPRDTSGAKDRAASVDPDERYIGATLHGATAALGQAADWNAATFARLARSSQVFVPVASLTRAELSADRQLSAARLSRSCVLVAAPNERVEITLDKYRDLAALASSRNQEAPSPSPYVRPRSKESVVLERTGTR